MSSPPLNATVIAQCGLHSDFDMPVFTLMDLCWKHADVDVWKFSFPMLFCPYV